MAASTGNPAWGEAETSTTRRHVRQASRWFRRAEDTAMDDGQLERTLRAAQAGDAAAFGQIYAQLSPRVLGLCMRMLGSRAAAEDATSEVFERAQAHLERYDAARPFDRWLLAIARNHCLQRLRRARTEQRLFEDEPPETPEDTRSASPLAAAETQETREAMRRAVDALPESYRVPLVLKYYEDLSYEEIAAHLDITRNHVAVLLHRGKRALRAAMLAEGREQA